MRFSSNNAFSLDFLLISHKVVGLQINFDFRIMLSIDRSDCDYLIYFDQVKYYLKKGRR